MISIVNYGLGNLTSIKNMMNRLGIPSKITSDPVELRNSSKLILPGVGHFKKGMENLNFSGLTDLLNEEVLINRKPILGICLGAQLMTNYSEEGDIPGLKWIDAETIKFNRMQLGDLKIPHMGWSEIEILHVDPLWYNMPVNPRFYFVHSYHFKFSKLENVSALTNYGYSFPCAFKYNNIYGAQFHPEKSHKFGMQLLKNFSVL